MVGEGGGGGGGGFTFCNTNSVEQLETHYLLHKAASYAINS